MTKERMQWWGFLPQNHNDDEEEFLAFRRDLYELAEDDNQEENEASDLPTVPWPFISAREEDKAAAIENSKIFDMTKKTISWLGLTPPKLPSGEPKMFSHHPGSSPFFDGAGNAACLKSDMDDRALQVMNMSFMERCLLSVRVSMTALATTFLTYAAITPSSGGCATLLRGSILGAIVGVLCIKSSGAIDQEKKSIENKSAPR